MFEKVSKYHPDKIADRISGALVDLAVNKDPNARIAVEVLIGHGICHIISETSVKLSKRAIKKIVHRIAGRNIQVDYKEVPQDRHLADNQSKELRCGDNGIFKAVPVTKEEKELCKLAQIIEIVYPSDGKYILANDDLIICQSNAKMFDIEVKMVETFPELFNGKKLNVNPLGPWTGGTNVDTGCTNRKLGSDLAGSITGGGINGKDLSKADVSVTIYCWLLAQKTGKEVNAYCAIGDKTVNIDGKEIKFSKIVEVAKKYIKSIGGFESLSEYGLVRHDWKN